MKPSNRPPRPRCPCGGVLRSKQERAAGQCWMCQLTAQQQKDAAAKQAGSNGTHEAPASG